MTDIEKQGSAAKEAARRLATCGTNIKNKALTAIAAAMRNNKSAILAANALDMDKARAGGMSAALLDRLQLTETRIDGIADGVLEVAALPDPIGKVENMTTRPNGLVIGRRKVPLGVIAIIYESRPNVTVDASVLCLKAGNAVILRGGKEAYNSNQAFTELMRAALAEVGLPQGSVSLVQDTTRDSVGDLMNMTDYIDVLIPRGGAGLIGYVAANSKVPVIKTGVGNCHVYVEASADLEMGANIIYNAKCSRPSVCNAAETLLVDRAIAEEFLPMAKALLDNKSTELRGCHETLAILQDAMLATQEDYYTEFSDYILAVKVVDGLDEAIAHINKHGSGHSEAIVTNNYAASQRFLDEIDAAAVYVNASTRFTDGGEFGLGAEIGISTQKMHARGPMGLEQLTSSKFVVYGSGQIR
ncbi:MAG: glutamate-5-semialdehyde dehydrogenase [Oscillospiraceae bacterium]|jgi:glutamate-5-semialdehyde dehydrogenase|nr:glutamate-5-semialdehyde dehydrogenase [Oscillospiraceae bacterium]